MDKKSASIVGVSLIIAALVITLVPRSQYDGVGHTIRSAEGLLTVSFSVTTSKSQDTESWVNNEVEGVTAIEFYPAFIVVQTKAGAGIVLFPDKTKGLSWKLKTVGEQKDTNGEQKDTKTPAKTPTRLPE